MEYDRVHSFFILILNRIEFHLVQNRKENCHHDHIPFNLKENGNLFFLNLKRHENLVSESHEEPIAAQSEK